MSDTPRTDAEETDGWSGDAFAVSADFARTLERELAACRERERVLKQWLATVLDQVDYTSGACRLTEMIGACLPADVIDKARAALKESAK